MESRAQLIEGPFGRFIRRENGLIYFYKADNVSVDKSTVEMYLDLVRSLDESGHAKVIVIQGNQVDYTFDAQRLLLTNKLLDGIAYVAETRAQRLAAEILQDMAEALHSRYPVRVFYTVEDAEDWYLNN